MTNKHMKKCPTSLAIKGHRNPVVIIDNTNIDKCWQGCKEKEPVSIVGGNVN
jgi:hypothetical protein